MDRFQRSGEIQRSFCDIAAHELGLPIVKEIAEAHGGTISVTSQVEKGSVFTLRLPVPTHPAIPA
jgi:signal transduction histidine kinase